MKDHFRSQLSYEKAADLNVKDILEKLAAFHFDKNNFEELSNSFKSIIEIQSKRLRMIIPDISYVVGNSSGLIFEEDSNGNTLEARQCTCLPDVPDSSSIQPVSVQYQCPEGKVSTIDGGPTLNIPCIYDDCPGIIQDTCAFEIMLVNCLLFYILLIIIRTQWTAWTDYCLLFGSTNCLSGRKMRTRKPTYNKDTSLEETEVILAGENKFNSVFST